MNNFNDFEKVAVMDGPFSVFGYRKKLFSPPVYNESNYDFNEPDYDWLQRKDLEFFMQCEHKYDNDNGQMVCCKCGLVDEELVFIDHFTRPSKKPKADSPRVRNYKTLFKKHFPNEEEIIGLWAIKYFDKSYIKLFESGLFTQRCPLMKNILYVFLKKYGKSDLLEKLKMKVLSDDDEKIREIEYILNYKPSDKAYIPSSELGTTDEYLIPNTIPCYGNVFSEKDVEDLELQDDETDEEQDDETDEEQDDETDEEQDDEQDEEQDGETTGNESETDDEQDEEQDDEQDEEQDGETTGDESETDDETDEEQDGETTGDESEQDEAEPEPEPETDEAESEAESEADE